MGRSKIANRVLSPRQFEKLIRGSRHGEKMKHALKLVLVDGKTQAFAADEVKVTRQHVWQTIKTFLRKTVYKQENIL